MKKNGIVLLNLALVILGTYILFAASSMSIATLILCAQIYGGIVIAEGVIGLFKKEKHNESN